MLEKVNKTMSMASSDNELIEGLRSNSEEALTLIFKKYWQTLFISAFNIVRNKDLCEDIVQDIFVKIWDRRHQIEITFSLKAYLFSSMRYEAYRQFKIINNRENNIKNSNLILLASSPYDRIVHKELITEIDTIVCQLPRRCKEVYQLSREAHLSHKEISQKLKISTKTVETHITKALSHLRTSLKQ